MLTKKSFITISNIYPLDLFRVRGLLKLVVDIGLPGNSSLIDSILAIYIELIGV